MHLPIFLVFIIISVLAFLFLFSLISTTVFIGTGALVVAAFLSIVLGVTLFTNAMWKKKLYIITPDRIVIQDGIFGSRQRVYNAKGNTGMALHQTPIKKMFNYGTITLSFMGGDTVNITNVRQPDQKIMLIQELLDKGEVTLPEK